MTLQDHIKILGIDGLPEEEQVAVLEKMTELLSQSILLRTLPMLTPHEKVELEALLDRREGPGELYAFLHDRVSSLDTIATEEAARLQEIMLSAMPELSSEERT